MEADHSKVWLSRRDMRPAAAMRLFCLPHAGAGAAGFYAWRRLLPADVDLCPIHLPGREDRASEAPYTDLRTLVDDLTAATMHLLDRPFAIFGHSMGALIAYEWSRRIELGGLRPELLVVSGRNAPQLSTTLDPLHLLHDEALVEALRMRYGAAHGDLLSDPEVRSMFLPILRADLELVESYRFQQGGPLVCPLMAVGGTHDPSISQSGLRLWRELTRGEYSLASFPGDHFYLQGEARAALINCLLDRLTGLSAS